MSFKYIDNNQIGDYFCTWSSQDRWQNNGNDAIFMRDRMDEDFLFSEDGVLNTIPLVARKGLIVVLDDGWDVDKGTLSNENRAEFGSLKLNINKFPSFKGEPQQRLKLINEKIQELGFLGVGLWIAPQCEGEFGENHFSFEFARRYWEEKARWCEYAGVLYWKVDWGEHCNDIQYMQMMTECVRKFAPNLMIEHTYVRDPLNEENDFNQNKERYKKTLEVCDYFRSYDVCEELSVSTTLQRISNILKSSPNAEAIINCEDELYIAAALGLSAGVMRSRTKNYNIKNKKNTDEIIRMVNWRENAPVFKINQSDFKISDEILSEEHYFDIDPSIWPFYGGTIRKQFAPAVIARNADLPTVENIGEEFPFVVCSKNPISGAFSIAALPKTTMNKTFSILHSNVSVKIKKSNLLFGIFGYYNTLSIEFDEKIKNKKIIVNDLCETEAYDITDEINITENKLVISGETIEKYGRKIKSYKDETSLPGLKLQLV